MKKTLVVASIACAFASAFNAYADAETPPRYLNWFDAIGTGASSASSLDPTNGEWNVSASGEKSWSAEDGLTYDLSTNYVTFTASQAAAPDTNTVTRVSLVSYFYPIVCSAISEIPSLDGSTEQIGFAAVAVTNAAGEATFKYCAWTGDSWFALDGAEPNDEEDVLTTLKAELDYRDTVPTVSFTIVSNGVDYALTTGSVEVVTNILVTSSKASGDKLYGFKCGGSGNIKSAQGLMAEAIAEIGGKKYISLAEATANAAPGSVIDVLAETDEDITLANGVAISNANGKVKGTISAGEGSTVAIDLSVADIGGGSNGTYTVDVKTSTSGSGTIAVIQPLPNKEIASGTTTITSDRITVTIHTKTELLAALRPDAANDKALAVDNTTNSPLRVFLEKYSPAYRSADASTESIQAELRSVPAGSNGLPLWQDYVLTIEPDTVVKPVAPAAGDDSSSYIKLSIPNLSGVTPIGYTVTYKVYKEGVADPVATTDSANAIQIPVSSGSGKYTVKAVLTPAP